MNSIQRVIQTQQKAQANVSRLSSPTWKDNTANRAFAIEQSADCYGLCVAKQVASYNLCLRKVVQEGQTARK